MGKDFYCPICGAFQEHVNLEETDNTFICNKCKSVIHFEKLSDDRSQIRFTVNNQRVKVFCCSYEPDFRDSDARICRMCGQYAE